MIPTFLHTARLIGVILLLAGVDVTGAILLKEAQLRKEPMLALAGAGMFVTLALLLYYALALTELTLVSLGWIVAYQAAVMVVDMVHYHTNPSRLQVLAVLIALAALVVAGVSGPHESKPDSAPQIPRQHAWPTLEQRLREHLAEKRAEQARQAVLASLRAMPQQRRAASDPPRHSRNRLDDGPVRFGSQGVTVKRMLRTTPPTAVEFYSQQARLRRMSGDLLARYRRELEAEISDPTRLAEVYGKAFANANTRHQAEVVAMMAAEMLHVPNAEVNIVAADEMTCIGAVHNHRAVEVMPDNVLEESFCQHVIGIGHELSIERAREHPLVCDQSVTTNGDVVSYLGVPIATRDGYIVGVLCVYDDGERQWTCAEVGLLTQLGLVLTRTMP